ncbi:NTP transferase domain-containing protein [Leptothoe spongobia TAU-MAC 1115]|uniref:Glucose-1-phosphate thymidylyltransferase n=1 Tax=Leptothoe spongobia TAU-MAC 1115 TaxID=1967444 RepID=A0A947GHB3_9CYAN|nr:sugar phosphate nucleotidyltransferase [Leptothoe spongobia]MBT9314593.1 NTP transferase domain-containing protein [Leptothoe spongobia TAU-MAC 1115]
MKGVLLAGGTGSRLYPLTQVVNKQLMPVYDKPMIYYPLSVLIVAGIREILVISTPHDLPLFRKLLGDGSQWGLNLNCKIQATPDGLAQAFILGKDFIDNQSVCLALGDNLLYRNVLVEILQRVVKLKRGGLIYLLELLEDDTPINRPLGKASRAKNIDLKFLNCSLAY